MKFTPPITREVIQQMVDAEVAKQSRETRERAIAALEAAKTRQTDAQKAETDNAIETFKALGLNEVGAKAAAIGREERGW